MTEPRLIEISPVTRVEGHGKVTIHLDAAGQVEEARLHIVEFRGFERFIQGRLMWEVPVIVQRLCGICPVSHHLAAAKAMDAIMGVDVLPPTAEKMRRLMHYGQVMQSHVLHFFHLAAPDLLFGFGAPAARRNVFEVIRENPTLGLRAVAMRRFGQEIIEATAGKKIHGTGAVPGGINRHLSAEARDRLRAQLPDMVLWAQDALSLARGYVEAHAQTVASFANFPSPHMALTRGGVLDLYDGDLTAIDARGAPLFTCPPADYMTRITEDVRSWSYMKFPYFNALGDQGWYRVGPLARMNVAHALDTPLARAAHQELRAAGVGGASLANHWARMIEVVHCVEKIALLLDDPDLMAGDLVAKGSRREEGVGVIEAPRGTLIHHYKVDERDQVTFCNLIVSTTHNNQAMNRAVTDVAVRHLSGVEITEGLLNHVEVAIRAYDPCLSCATHALGQMPLQVQILQGGRVLAEVTR